MQPNRIPCEVLKPSKIWHRHESEFDSHAFGLKRPSNQYPALRSLFNFQRELQFAPNRNRVRRLNEAAI